MTAIVPLADYALRYVEEKTVGCVPGRQRWNRSQDVHVVRLYWHLRCWRGVRTESVVDIVMKCTHGVSYMLLE